MNEQTEQLISIISDTLCDLKPLRDHCNEVAVKESGYDTNLDDDDSAVAKLYWSTYNEEMTRITLLSVASWVGRK
jgi:hypothetical protein